MPSLPNKAVLFDRDGTLIEGRHYLNDPEDVVLERSVVPALRSLHEAGYLLIVVTNQSGIGRGLISPEAYQAVQDRMMVLLEAHGLTMRDIYYCPHHPTEAKGAYLQDCECRKPKPGMIESAIRDHRLDRSTSFMVGNSPSDVQAGRAAGLRSILVQPEDSADMPDAVQPDYVAEDLLDAAVNYILS